MNRIKVAGPISGLLVTIALLATSINAGENTSAQTNNSEAVLSKLHVNLFYSRVVADASKCTVLLDSVDRGDLDTAKRVLILWLEGDLEVIQSQTNRLWSEGEKAAIARARECIAKRKQQRGK